VGGVSLSSIGAKDMNGDGAPGIVSIGTSPNNNVVWSESSHQQSIGAKDMNGDGARRGFRSTTCRRP
jgi:hypothetical protein